MMRRSPAGKIPRLLVGLSVLVAGCSDAVSTAIEDLKHADSTVRAAAARRLSELETSDPRAISALAEVVDDEQTEVRRLACFALGVISPPNDDAAATALRSALQDSDAGVQRAAAHALARVAPADRTTVDALVEAATQGDLRAVVALGQLGPAAESAVQPLIRIATTSNLLVRVKAIEALGRIGPAAAEAAPFVADALRAKDPEVRRVARDALRNIRGKEAE